MLKDDCLFCRMIKGEIPTTKIYEDEDMIVIKDICGYPKIHYLMIPKDHYADITEMSDEQANILGKCIKELGVVAKEILHMDNGFRIVSNKGQDGCQSIPHLHIHLIGGEQLSEKMG